MAQTMFARDAEPADGRLRWDVTAFLVAWEAGAFPDRVELIEGDLHVVTPPGRWHGEAPFRLHQLLNASPGLTVTGETLVLGPYDAPDPDLWVHRTEAEPTGMVTDRVATWDPGDVLLVVEFADATRRKDLGVKADLYARAEIGCYWVVTPTGVVVHTRPGLDGYADRHRYESGQLVPFLDRQIPAADIIGYD